MIDDSMTHSLGLAALVSTSLVSSKSSSLLKRRSKALLLARGYQGKGRGRSGGAEEEGRRGGEERDSTKFNAFQLYFSSFTIIVVSVVHDSSLVHPCIPIMYNVLVSKWHRCT
jgi:hypothetical protein